MSEAFAARYATLGGDSSTCSRALDGALRFAQGATTIDVAAQRKRSVPSYAVMLTRKRPSHSPVTMRSLRGRSPDPTCCRVLEDCGERPGVFLLSSDDQ